MRFEDQTVIVTGASSGIGAAAARRFAAEGANVVLCARGEERLEEVAAAIGERALIVAGDVADEEVAQKTVALAEERFGGVDVAILNAGTLGEMGPVQEVSAEGWRNTLATNLDGAFFGVKHALPAMARRGRGAFVFTSAFVGATLGFPGMAAYAAAKAGVVGLMRVVAVEGASAGIRSNAILSGGVDTPMGRTVASTPESLGFVEGLHALKRIATPDEIAAVALFLASPEASFVTGAALAADGGLTITRT